ncbi:XRE family transcriptional regulator [Sedimentisphaera salicampi]|uniref:XRE family transcriptional regulator n=1 Tax=Sedimentisphaera salicampi TaxID=1941349 RepID=UPI000B9AE77F|nr:XRE family transcriptional regulator [Sedimentisphaera salicampi]OXU15036.1 helix-turn-helix protein [Sedimentisphaera salicampi]
MKRVEANITPEVIKWARKTAGYSLEEAAHKIGRSEDEITAWETGEKKPTIPQARNAAKVYKRSLAVFFLPFPPKDFSTLRDFRKLPADFPRDFSPNLRFLIRQTQNKQSWLREYLIEEGYQPLSFIGSASTSTSPEKLAVKIEKELRLNREEILKCNNSQDALNLWIAQVEKAGIYVFQSGNMQHEKIDIEEARGFALADKYAPFIFLNAQDAKVAQIFTLAHELAHLWIDQSGISNLLPQGRTLPGMNKIEVFCNSVSGKLILPEEHFYQIWTSLDNSLSIKERIENTSTNFKVSKEVVARRLFDLGYLDQKLYSDLAKQFSQEWFEYKEQYEKKKSTTTGGPHPYLLKVINNGRNFSRTVLAAYQGGNLSGKDTSRILGIKLNKLSKFASYAGVKLH